MCLYVHRAVLAHPREVLVAVSASDVLVELFPHLRKPHLHKDVGGVGGCEGQRVCVSAHIVGVCRCWNACVCASTHACDVGMYSHVHRKALRILERCL